MDPRVSIFLNSYCVMLAGMFIVVMMLDALFPRRHSLGVFVAFILLRGFAWSLYDVSYVMGTIGDFEHDFQIVGTALFGVLNYAVVYYTWKTDFAKIGIGTYIGDALAACIAMVSYYVTHQLFGVASASDYRGYLGPWTLFFCVFMLALYAAVLRLAKPLCKWFGAYELVHKKAWTAVAVMMPISATAIRMFSEDQIRESSVAGTSIVIVLALVFAGYMLNRVRVERKRKELLAREVDLVESYDRSIGEQLTNLEQGSAQLDEIAAYAANVQAMADGSNLDEQVAGLRRLCDALRHGVYSDCPALDVVLSTSAREFEKRGFQVDFRVPPLGDAGLQAALLSQAMLAWLVESLAINGQDVAPEIEGACALEASPVIDFRIIRGGGQLAFLLNAPSDRHRHFPQRFFKERAMSAEATLWEHDDGVRKTLNALVEVAEAEAL